MPYICIAMKDGVPYETHQKLLHHCPYRPREKYLGRSSIGLHWSRDRTRETRSIARQYGPGAGARGITIKSHAIQMEYIHEGETYVLNLIDTPGHVDFSYEVSRSIAACEGALLIVDAAQSIQAQTISNLYLALENDLEIIPVLNKVDLPSANPEEVTDDIVDLLGCAPEDVIPASAKTGLGIQDILTAIIDRIPAPKGSPDEPLQALIFDSVYNPFRGRKPISVSSTGGFEKDKKSNSSRHKKPTMPMKLVRSNSNKNPDKKLPLVMWVTSSQE